RCVPGILVGLDALLENHVERCVFEGPYLEAPGITGAAAAARCDQTECQERAGTTEEPLPWSVVHGGTPFFQSRGRNVETFVIFLISFGSLDARAYPMRSEDHLLLQPYHDIQRMIPSQGEVDGPKSFEKLSKLESRGEGDRVAGALGVTGEALWGCPGNGVYTGGGSAERCVARWVVTADGRGGFLDSAGGTLCCPGACAIGVA